MVNRRLPIVGGTDWTKRLSEIKYSHPVEVVVSGANTLEQFQLRFRGSQSNLTFVDGMVVDTVFCQSVQLGLYRNVNKIYSRT